MQQKFLTTHENKVTKYGNSVDEIKKGGCIYTFLVILSFYLISPPYIFECRSLLNFISTLCFHTLCNKRHWPLFPILRSNLEALGMPCPIRCVFAWRPGCIRYSRLTLIYAAVFGSCSSSLTSEGIIE